MAISASGLVEVVQLTIAPSKQPSTGQRQTFPAGMPNCVTSVSHRKPGSPARKSRLTLAHDPRDPALAGQHAARGRLVVDAPAAVRLVAGVEDGAHPLSQLGVPVARRDRADLVVAAGLPEPDARSALMPVTARLKYIAENEWGRRRYLDMIEPEEMNELARAEEQEQGDRRGLEWGRGRSRSNQFAKETWRYPSGDGGYLDVMLFDDGREDEM